MFPTHESLQRTLCRRAFLNNASVGLGRIALGSLLGGMSQASLRGEELSGNATASGAVASQLHNSGLPGLPHFAPRAKRVIYMFQSGGPSQVDLFDTNDELQRLHGTELPVAFAARNV